jgi:hypothetical protein
LGCTTYYPFTLSNWAKIKHGVSQGSILGSLLFLLYTNDLPKIINNKSLLILFPDNTSILFIISNLTNYNKDILTVFQIKNKWFKENFLSLNFEKTHNIHFITKNNQTTNMEIVCDDKLIPIVSHTKFLGINIDSTLSWTTHIEQLITKLSTACYIIRSIKPYTSHTTLFMVCYSIFHSIMNYGLIFWGNSSYSCKILGCKRR